MAFLYVGQQLLLGGYLDLSEVIAMPLPLGFDLDLLLLEQGQLSMPLSFTSDAASFSTIS